MNEQLRKTEIIKFDRCVFLYGFSGVAPQPKTHPQTKLLPGVWQTQMQLQSSILQIVLVPFGSHVFFENMYLKNL